MSTLEKAINLMNEMPEQKIETIYAFIQFINSQASNTVSPSAPEKKKQKNQYLALHMNMRTQN